MSEKKRNFLKFIKSGTYTDKSGNRTNTDRAASRVKKIDLDLETMKPASTKKMLTGGQAKIASKAPPYDEIGGNDFAVLKKEKAKGRGMGLQDEKVKPGKVQKAALGMLALGMMGKKYLDKKKSSSSAPMMGAAAELMKKKKEILGKRMGGVMKYKRGMGPGGLDLPVISSVKPAVHKTKKAQKTAVMKEQFNKQKSRLGKNPNMTPSSPRAGEKFLKRRKELSGVGKALAATRVGKMLLPVGAAGVAAQQYLKSKMKKKDKKMGGGMMQKPMGYKTGGGYDSGTPGKLRDYSSKFNKDGVTYKNPRAMGPEESPRLKKLIKKKESKDKALKTTKSVLKTLSSVGSPMSAGVSAVYKIAKNMRSKDRLTERDIETARSAVGIGSKNRPIKKDHSSRNPNPKTPKMMNMGGMMMQRPMGYSKGVSVKARGCKLGRTKPTKIT